MNKKGKIFVRIFAGVMAGLMVLGSMATFLYVIFIN